eukprot:c19803_g1_i3.p1 GENE.c19803_g1_i3~~c19803_g1_i3.p1  ORF type:complete len:143 (+),score=36.46 c19803_g1_i3:200-628(+)
MSEQCVGLGLLNWMLIIIIIVFWFCWGFPRFFFFSRQAAQSRSVRDVAVFVIGDVVNILELQVRGVQLALSDIFGVFQAALQEGAPSKTVQKALKKLEFFFAWAETVAADDWQLQRNCVSETLEEMLETLPKESAMRARAFE